jgi:glycosyltransferase involved in cell wall biosynthesis/predicted O-methyltransferase YrrM
MRQHILLYTDQPDMGGVAQYNHALLVELISRGFRVTCVQNQADNMLIRQQQQLGVEHQWLSFDPIAHFDRNFTNAADAAARFEQTRPDLILFSDGCPVSNFAAKQAAMQLQIAYLVVVGFVADYLAEEFAFCLDALTQQYEQARSVIAVSQENLHLLRTRFNLPVDRGQVIHYGRPDAFFAPRDQSRNCYLRQIVDIPPEATVCFTTARLEEIKGYLYQLAAIRQLKSTAVWEKLHFVWAGEGPLREPLTTALAELRVTDRVHLLGQRWDVSDWLDVADIFVFPSQLEGMPLAVIEAMAKGIPIAATAVSGIPEALGDTGKLLPDPKVDPDGTIAALVATIQTWAMRPEQRAATGQAGQRRAAQMFREDRMVQETLGVIERALLPVGDYVSPGLAIVQPDAAFPNMEVGDPDTCPWEHLRRDVPHNWYVDRRQPIVGFLSRDEAHILYNTALQFQGKRALEIGCWLGWSACHLALAGVELDVVDPLLARSDFYQSVSDSLEAAGVRRAVNLVAGYSPQAVEALATQQRQWSLSQWSLIFIDGDHEAPGPLQDAIVCERLAAPDALIVFHDLASPDVAQGLDYLRQRGWHTQVYQTMQIMGVAWRGNVQPIAHQPDPKVKWQLPQHLQNYTVSGIAEQNGHGSTTEHVSDPRLQALLNAVESLRLPPVQPMTLDRSGRQQLAEWLRQGQQAYIQGDRDTAIAAFGQAVTLNPGSTIAHQHLSSLAWQQGDLQRSLAHYKLAQSGGAAIDEMQNQEFQSLMAAVRPFTLLSPERLFSLYSLAKQICLDDIPGHFVECGTCRGGSAALLAAVIQRYSLRPRRLYAFDTFEGMPEPTAIDRHQGIPANLTGFGAGTLKAPRAKYLNVICKELGVTEIVVPVAGLFAQTLPRSQPEIADIAFLHADGDWYESTMDIFNTLYDSVVADGFIQVDDYEHWEGCQQAIHQFERSRQTVFPLRAIDDTGVWFRKQDAAHTNCNHGQVLWHLAETAVRLGNVSLAAQFTQAVLKLLPRLVSAAALLVELGVAEQPQKARSQPGFIDDSLRQEQDNTDWYAALRLRQTNLIVFPDWSQPEDLLFSALVNLLRSILTHPDRQQITLLIDTHGIDAENADLAISSVVMHLLTEAALELDGKAEIVLLEPLPALQWQTLLPQLTARIPLTLENQQTIAALGADRLPVIGG